MIDRYCGRRCLTAVAVAAALSSSAHASQTSGSSQGSIVAGGAPYQACILHVWPSADAHSSYSGWFHGGAIDGDKRGIKGYPNLHSEVLSITAQQQLLGGMKWLDLPATRDFRVIVHDQPPQPQDDQSRTTPLIADRPACYEEMLVHSVLVEKAPFTGVTVRVMAILKRWASSGSAVSTYSGMASSDTNLDDQGLKSGFVTSIQKILRAAYFQQDTGAK